MRWSNNSCAYDSLFTPLFSLWSSDREGWKDKFNSMNNSIALQLIDGFFRYEQEEISLEDACDYVRQMLSRSQPALRFGRFASIERLCEELFTTSFLHQQNTFLLLFASRHFNIFVSTLQYLVLYYDIWYYLNISLFS